MDYTYIVTKAEKAFSLPDDMAYMDVTFNVLGDYVLDEEQNPTEERTVLLEGMRLSFAMDSSEESIRETLSKYCAVYQADAERKVSLEEQEAVDAQADEVMSALVGN